MSSGDVRVVGSLFDDRYELLEQLGSGEFGEVWRARDQHLDRVVALKVLKSNDEDAAWQEARRLIELQSPYILPIHNAALAIDVPYLDTELATGGTAEDLLMPHGVASRSAIRIVRGVLAGLELAHQRRILHRDVKPANVFLRGNGDAQLGDFGVAAFMDAANSAKAHGDLDVRAPEVLKGGRLTVTSDVYSAGITLWALLAGKIPVAFDPMLGFAEHKQAVLDGVPYIRDVAPGVSRSLATVVRKACAVKVADRYGTAAELDNALSIIRTTSADITRVASHTGHRDCWRVARQSDGHLHDVCVVANSSGALEVVTRHSSSGNRVAQLCRKVRTEQSARVALRRAFDRLG